MVEVSGQFAALGYALRADYAPSRMIFVLGHMRCGSTALSNIFCSRADVTGFGEAQVSYRRPFAMRHLAWKFARRGVVKPGEVFGFDKVLHNYLDQGMDYAGSRRVFLAREPAASFRSIRHMYETIHGRGPTDPENADYYEGRMTALLALIDRARAEPGARFAVLSHAALVGDADAALAHVSARLELDPPLENRYDYSPPDAHKGVGDPIFAGRQTSIVRKEAGAGESNRGGNRGGADPVAADAATLDLPPARIERMLDLYRQFTQRATFA